MTVARHRSSRSLAFFTALAILFALAIPFAGVALASHAADNSHDLQVTPEVDTNPTGTTHTLIAYVPDCTTDVCEIDFEIESGPAVTVNRDSSGTAARTTDADNSPTSPDMTCIIDTNAADDPVTPFDESAGDACAVSFTSNTQGVNIIRAWVDDDQDNTTVDADTTEGRFAGGADCGTVPVTGAVAEPTTGANDCDTGAAAVPGSRTEVDDTDVVQKTWGQGLTQACIDAEPETDTNPSGTDHDITARVTGGNAYTGGDTAGQFDCAGSALPNTRVTVTITDDDPNVFIKAINGVSTGGPTGGGPNTATGTTDANGQLVVTIACVSGAAASCTGTNTVDLQVEGAGAGPGDCGTACDQVAKTWQQAGNATALDATPETDVNEIGQQHVITCRVNDAFGTGVANANCDAQVTGGTTGNQTRDLDNNALTVPGYIGDCNTAADGTCTVSYTSTVTGQDTITVWNDVDGDDIQDGGETMQDVITKDWVAVGQGTQDVDADMSNDVNNNATCDGLADGNDDNADDAQATNPTNTSHEVCAERFGPTGERDPGPITFRIVSGPGAFYNDANNNNVQNTNEPNLGTTVTRQEGTCSTADAGFNCIEIFSTERGTTTIEACAEGTTTCATVTKTWTAGAARNIDCTPATATNRTGTSHVVTCTVTDRFGNRIAGYNGVVFSEEGPGRIEGSQTQFTTDSQGQADVVVTTQPGEEGTQTITGEIADDLFPTDSDTSSDLDDACDQGAGNLSTDEGDNSDVDTDNAQNAPAGNCEDVATKVWDDQAGGGEFPEQEFGGETGQPVTEGACAGFTTGSVQANPTTDGIVIVGTNGPDALQGTEGADLICALGDDDAVQGHGGNDTIYGGGGKDGIEAGAGDDTVFGEGDKDIILGDDGNDELDGGQGNDNMGGGGGADVLLGRGGWDTLKGNAGNDLLIGAKGRDILQGGGGNDTARGGADDDVLKGFEGRDVLRGGGGDDIIKGAAGRDRLFGNAGADFLHGGPDRDRCRGGRGRDVLRSCP